MIANNISHRAMYHIIFFAFIMLFVSIASTSEALTLGESNCDIHRALQLTRPDPNGPPTVVDIDLFVIDVSQIKDADQTFQTDFFITIKWKDPRLSKAALGRSLKHCRILLDEIWNPALNLVNIGGKVQKIYDEKVAVDDEGNVKYVQRGIGPLLSPFNLEKFPFDKQILPITFVSLEHGPDEVILNVKTEESGIREKLSIVGWHIDPEITFETYTENSPRFGKLSLFKYKMTAERQSNYFVWVVMFSLSLIVMMAWSVFWIDPSELGPQIGISTATVIALIAFRFAISNDLPRIPFLTVMDKFILFSTLLIFLALGESIIVSKIARGGNVSLARRIDEHARWVYLGLFILLLVYTYLQSLY